MDANARVLGLIGRLYETAFESPLLAPALRELADLVRGSGTVLQVVDPATGACRRHELVRVDADRFAEYAARWLPQDPRVAA